MSQVATKRSFIDLTVNDVDVNSDTKRVKLSSSFDSPALALVTTTREEEEQKQIEYYKAIIGKKEADAYLQRLKVEVPWTQMKWSSRGNLPRLIYALEPSANIGVLNELRSLVEMLFNVTVEGIFCNQYRSGKDWTPEHQDSYEMDVYTLSFGATRKFYFLNLKSGKKLEYELSNGDLLYFTPQTNLQHKHCLPKASPNIGTRISIVFFCHRS